MTTPFDISVQAYDPVDNRLRQETHNTTNIYTYDAANRLIEVDGVIYEWDVESFNVQE